jgi:predicted secreted hydrolase
VHFPRDEAAHKAATEWWYTNGHLVGDDGRQYAFMLTFFKVNLGRNRLLAILPSRLERLAYPLIEGRIVQGHIVDVSGKRFRPYYLHYGALPFLAHASRKAMHVHFGPAREQKHQGHYDLSFRQGGDALGLRLKPLKPVMQWGRHGIIPMGVKGDSYYYSYTRMEAEGELMLDGRPRKVKGIAWLDHQWGQWDLFDDRWTWFSIQLSNRTEIMVFSFEHAVTKERIVFAGAAMPDGSVRMLKGLKLTPGRCWKSPATGKRYPVAWQLALPELRLKLAITAFVPGQEMADPRTPSYYEGACSAAGMMAGKRVTGKAYLEIADFSRDWLERAYGRK